MSLENFLNEVKTIHIGLTYEEVKKLYPLGTKVIILDGGQHYKGLNLISDEGEVSDYSDINSLLWKDTEGNYYDGVLIKVMLKKNGYNYSWWMPPLSKFVKKKSTSKYIRQLKFESLNESKEFKVGDKVRCKKNINGYSDDKLETKNLVGVIRKNYQGKGKYYGVEFDKKIHTYDTTGEPINFKKGIEYVWWMEVDDIEKISTSKYVRQLNFNEALEPGQYTEADYYVVKVGSVSKSKTLQKFAFENGFKWGGNRREYYTQPIDSYKDEACIHLNFETKDLEYCGITFFSKNIKDYGEIFELADFFEMMEDDSRIKVKPSMIKKEK